MSDKKEINILIVEDHDLTRFGLKTGFENNENFKSIQEAEDGESAIELVKNNKFDIAIVDLGLPGINGIETTQKLKELQEDISIIILTSHNTDEEIWMALAAGANAYCIKGIEPKRLIGVVESVYEGAAWLDPAIADKVLKEISTRKVKPANKNTNSLTERELDVLNHIVDGYNNADIAEKLFVSIHTVKAHVCNILHKLSVDDRTQAAIKALKDGIV